MSRTLGHKPYPYNRATNVAPQHIICSPVVECFCSASGLGGGAVHRGGAGGSKNPPRPRQPPGRYKTVYQFRYATRGLHITRSTKQTTKTPHSKECGVFALSLVTNPILKKRWVWCRCWRRGTRRCRRGCHRQAVDCHRVQRRKRATRSGSLGARASEATSSRQFRR